MLRLSSHRRARRRSRSGRIVVVFALLVLAVLIGGLIEVGAQSGPFDASVNRSFAAQGAVVANESTATASTVRHLMETSQQQDRQTLQAELDSFAAQSSQQAAAAAALASADSRASLEGQFAAVFFDRSEAVNQLRSAMDGLLGMHPLAVAGAPVTIDRATSSTLLTSIQATDRIAAAGRLLAQADRRYASIRHALAHVAGYGKLPSSKWVTGNHEWQIGSVARQVDLMASSPSLAVTHRLVLSVVQLTPPALPSPSGVASPTVSMLSPTTTVVLNVVLSNLGSTEEPHASVQFSLTPEPTGTAVVKTRRAAVSAGGSVGLSAAAFHVKPGSSYLLNVAVVLPPGQTDEDGASLSEVLQIAPEYLIRPPRAAVRAQQSWGRLDYCPLGVIGSQPNPIKNWRGRTRGRKHHDY